MRTLNVTAPAWHAKAACAESPPEWFVLPEGRNAKNPNADDTAFLCGKCLVRQDCEDDARDNRDVGVYRAGLELRRPLPICRMTGCTKAPRVGSRDCSDEHTARHLEIVAKARKKAGKTGPIDECKDGHDLSKPENVYGRPDGGRECAECRRIADRARNKARTEAHRAAMQAAREAKAVAAPVGLQAAS